MARQQRHWRFNQDEGLLDTARLTRIVLHPGNPLAYKQELEGEFPTTAVTLLVDNSGSMHGLPILHAALCIDVLVKTLEQCHISTEVLGYTTTGWQEQALEYWANSGKPSQPGRLNGLQRLVFKAASQRWRNTQHSLGWLLQNEDMRENIDGEALQWAASRLLNRPETRKILIVLADGAPRDEATQAANGRGLLEQHLQQVSERLDSHTEIELLGIGLGHDLSRYYSRSAVIHQAEQMAEVLITELDGLLVKRNGLDRSETIPH
jgi:cobaltochelatase CobT